MTEGVLVVERRKSVIIATLLGLLFGPLGLLYSTLLGAFVMFLVALVLGLLTGGFAALLVWPFCVAWAFAATIANNATRKSRVARAVARAQR